MKISLITINRNNAPGLKRTLASIREQLPKTAEEHTLEHIIVDGMSTDGSLSVVIPELNSRTISSEPKGVYNAINVGVREATGDIIGLLHSGDVFEAPDILHSVLETFSSEKSLDFIWGDVSIGRRLYSSKDFKPGSLETGFAPPHPSLYIRKEVYASTGPYDESYITAADFEYFVRLFSNPTLRGEYLPRNMVRMQPGGMSQSFSSRLTTNNRERLRALSSHGLRASRLMLLLHYKQVLKGYLCFYRKK